MTEREKLEHIEPRPVVANTLSVIGIFVFFLVPIATVLIAFFDPELLPQLDAVIWVLTEFITGIWIFAFAELLALLSDIRHLLRDQFRPEKTAEES